MVDVPVDFRGDGGSQLHPAQAVRRISDGVSLPEAVSFRRRVARAMSQVRASSRGQGWVSPTILIICSLAAAEPVQAQSGRQDFVKPKLVINGLGHTAPLRSLTFSPDGKYLLSGGTDKVVHIWEFRQGHPRLTWSIRPPINRKARVGLCSGGLTSTGSRRVVPSGRRWLRSIHAGW